jgi:hypothetical protein
MNRNPNQPLKKFKAGAVSATIWENQNKNPKGQVVTFNSVTLERTYKDANDEWQKTSTMRSSDLPKASMVLNKAYEFLSMSDDEEMR